jgi:hypothetical protein
MPSDFDLRKHVQQLAAEFQRRGMKKHLSLLREFYRFEFVGRVKPLEALSIDLVLDWLALMQIGPLARIYPVYPRNALPGCPFCKTAGGPNSGTFTETAWEGGHRTSCTVCKRSWLILD